MSEQKNAVAKDAGPLKVFKDWLDYSKGQIAMALPKHLTAERMIRMATTTITRNPELLECTPVSVCGAVIQAAELGLELSGPLGQAYLVPFYNKNIGKKEAQFQVGYRGLIQLAYRSGRVKTFNAHAVHQNDYFDFAYGTDSFLKHKPADKDRGEITHVYAVVLTVDGGQDFEVMSADDVEQHRKRYSKQKSQYSPWETAWEEMAKKTPLRRLAKRVPMSIELTKAAALDEYAEHEVAQDLGTTLMLPNSAPTEPPVGRDSIRNGKTEPLPAPKPDDSKPPKQEPPQGEQIEMSNESEMAIRDEMIRTGADSNWLNGKVRDAGKQRFSKLSEPEASAILTELLDMPDKGDAACQSPSATTTAAAPKRRFS